MTGSVYKRGRRFVRTPPRGSSAARPRAGDIYHSAFRGVCPTCRELCDGTRLIRGERVVGRVVCAEHGASEALLSGDAQWFLESLSCIKPGSIPHRHSTEVARGCPDDCGLCP
ncbi:MAG: hypothetical protein GY842_14575, partial [bacterium]|nr:hypothetical protein [bacterium]